MSDRTHTDQSHPEPGAGTCDRRAFVLQGSAALAAFSLLPELVHAAPRRRGAAMPVAVIGVGRQGRAILGELLGDPPGAAILPGESDVDQLARTLPPRPPPLPPRGSMFRSKDAGSSPALYWGLASMRGCPAAGFDTYGCAPASSRPSGDATPPSQATASKHSEGVSDVG